MNNKFFKISVAFAIVLSLFGQLAVPSVSVLKTEENESTNLAHHKPTTYSGVEGGKNSDGSWKYPQFVGEMVVDGINNDKDKRWSGNKDDDAWVSVDLGKVEEISDVLIYFESAAPKYQILVSTDGTNWDCVYEETAGEHGANGMVQASFDKTEARYVKYQQLEQWKHPGNGKFYSTSIYELEVYEEIAIENIELASDSDAISVGSNLQLQPEITPALAANKKVVYSSSNENIATVDASGKIIGIGAGAATITVASEANGAIFTTFTIEVVDGPVTVNKIVLEADEMTLTPRDKRFVNYQVYPSQATNPDLEVIWESSNSNVVKVNNDGLIECGKTGEAVISISSKENPEITASMRVLVKQPNYVEDYDTMQDRWLRRVIGDDSMDLNDKDVKAYVDNISVEAATLWEQMDKSEGRTYLWENTDSTVSADYTTQFTKIKKLALAFGMKGTEFYQNKELFQDILGALDFMYNVKKYNGSYTTGNWWDWQIGCTHQLVDTLVILKDYAKPEDIKLSIASVEGYAKDPSKQMPSVVATGANRTDIGLAVLGSAIVARNDERMELVKTKVPDVMKLVTKGDGLYSDGSVVQHTAHAYTGSYGNELMKGIGKIQSITTGTAWEIVDERIENVFNTAINGYIPLMERGRMMAMVNGRSIARAPGTNPFTTELASGSETVSNMMLIAQFAPKKDSEKLYASIKHWLEASEGQYDFFKNARDVESLLNAKSILDSDTIEATRYTGMKVYGSMDRVVQAKDTYAVGLAMYSSRVYNYEYGNTENPRGWHLADGALYTYTNDFKQYGEGYWTTIDALRIPGTTSDTRARKNGADKNEKQAQSLVGGTTDGTNGTAAMYLNKDHVTDMDLKAKKSWFFLDGKVVAVGSDIDGTTTDSIETTVENRVISDDSNVSVNGSKWTNNEETLSLNDRSYVHYNEKATNTQIGYYFPKAQELQAKIEERTGRYSDINDYFVNDKTYTMDYFTLGMNHGKNVVDGSYEYVLFPDASEEQMAAYAQNNDLEIIRNLNAHAIKEGNVFAMNTFADDVTVNGYTVSEPACIYTTKENGKLRITISNPKQNAISLSLKIDQDYLNIVSKDEHIQEIADGEFTIDTSGAAGASFTMELQIELNTAALEDEIAQSEAIINESVNYIPSTIKALPVAVEDAKVALTNATTQKEVDDATLKLSSVRKLATLLADTTKLRALIAEVETMDLTTYNVVTVQVLTKELEQAKIVVTDPESTQKLVDDQVDKLQVAVDGLIVQLPNVDIDQGGDSNTGTNTGDTTNVNALYVLVAFAALGLVTIGRKKYKEVKQK